MDRAKKYIEDIKKRQLRSDKEFVLDSLTGAIDRLQKAFPRYGSFLMEFVQNADDAGSRSMRIEMLRDTVRIYNDGLPFAEKDVKSICKVGRSSKTPMDYIGYLGVGFKAVFLICERPEVYSGSFRFEFAKDGWDDPEHTPWQVIPLWIEEPRVEFPEKYTTIFNLPLKETALMGKLKEEVKPENLNERILLFLRNVREIEIIDLDQKSKRRIIKSELFKNPYYEIHQTQEYENDVLKKQDCWLIFSSSCMVPKEVKEDLVTKEWERENVAKREVVAAFRLGEDDNLTVEREGTAYIGVFSFTPLKEIPSGLNFLIQADFLTTPGRGELARESLWNNWLADEIYDLIVDKCIPNFLTHEKWRMNFTQVLYSVEAGHELFENHIKKPLNEYLKNNAVLIAEDGSTAKAEGLVSLAEEIKGLLSNQDFGVLFPEKKTIHKSCKPAANLKIETPPVEIYEFLRSSISDKLLDHKAKSKDVSWFSKLYFTLVDKYDKWNYFYDRRNLPGYGHYNVEHDHFWDGMCSFHKPIILTDDYGLAKIDGCYTNPMKLKIPEEIKDMLKVVHSEVATSEEFKRFNDKLNEEREYHYVLPAPKGIRELTEDDIKTAISKKEALEMNEERWVSLSEGEKVQKIKHLRDLWARRLLSLEGYHFLTVKSKTGAWGKPSELVFPQEYKPEHNIEVLTEKSLLDIPLKFVSPEFIQGNTDNEIRIWRRFLKELGVDRPVDSAKQEGCRKGGIVHRVGVLAALKYERGSDRSPRELGESEQLGYDIESKSQGEGRHIEVKGTSDSSYDIFLTVNELRTLRDKQDRYFVYVVTDALKNPIVHITRGDKLLDIPDIKIVIPFAKWRDHAQEEEFQP